MGSFSFGNIEPSFLFREFVCLGTERLMKLCLRGHSEGCAPLDTAPSNVLLG